MEGENGNGNGGVQPIDVSQILSQLGQQQQLPWSEVTKRTVEMLKKMDPKDRMNYSRCVVKIINALRMSMKGWNDWLISLDVLDDLSEEDFSDISKKLKEYAIELKTISILTEVLKNSCPKDRVERAVLIADSVNTVNSALADFNYFFTGLKSMAYVSEDVWKALFPKFKKIAIEILSVDFHITKKKEGEFTEKLKKEKPKIKEESQRYVS